MPNHEGEPAGDTDRCVKLQCGVTKDMFDFVFVPFHFDCLTSAWTNVPQLCSVRFLRALPQASRDLPISAVQFYVDGSYSEPAAASQARAGWAICALVFQECQWRWLGLIAVPCACEGSLGTLGVPVRSSFEPELAAIVHAMAFACAVSAPVMIAYDNMSAGQVAGGTAVAEVQTPLTRAAASLLHLLDLLHRTPAFLHTKSHQGQPLNEFVDSAAKAAAQGQHYGTLPDTLRHAVEDEVLPWLWVALGLQPSIPRVCLLIDNVASSPGPHLQSLLPPVPERGQARFALRAASYNALTVASHAQRESLNIQFKQQRLRLIGVQEARCTGTTRQQAKDFHILNSDAQQGQCGCQIWLSKTDPIGKLGGQSIFWDASGISVVFKAPRFLSVVAKAGGVKLAFSVHMRLLAGPRSKSALLGGHSLTVSFGCCLPTVFPCCSSTPMRLGHLRMLSHRAMLAYSACSCSSMK